MKYFLGIVIGFLLIELNESYNIITPAFLAELEEEILGTKSHDDTLIFAHVLYRHGARNIAKVYPNDPYKDEKHWPGGHGQLTKEGKRQQYRLGQYLRRRYDELVGDKYSPNKVYVQSTDTDRTLMSAQANLAGLFMPNNDEMWNDEILWQPVPVHTIPHTFDHVLSGGKPCPKYNAILANYTKESKEVQQIYTKYADHFVHWSQMCGKNISTIGDVTNLYDTLSIEKKHNKPLKPWAEKAIQRNGIMEYITKFSYGMYTNTRQLARLKGGFLLKDIVERFSQKINSTLKPDYSLWLYSAHDNTVSNVLNGLKVFKLHIPPYACSLHFELYKTEDHEYYIQVFYRTSEEENPLPLNLPGCGEKCPFDKFQSLYSEIIPGEFESECRLS